MTIPRGLLVGTLAILTVNWVVFALDPGRNIVATGAQSSVYLLLFVVTVRSRRIKVLIARTFQRWVLNPLVRVLLSIGVNPLGLALLETTGRTSGKPRRVPVGNGRSGDSFWIIAEHGARAGYVRNIRRDPRVRVRLRVGLRYRWISGIATVPPDDDPLARQRRIIAWHPLRAFNAMNVRVLGADLLTVHVQLLPGPATPAATRAATTRAATTRAATTRAATTRAATTQAAINAPPRLGVSTNASR